VHQTPAGSCRHPLPRTQRDWKARLHYTFIERDEDRRRDLARRVKSEDVAVSRTSLVNGVPFERLVERNGRFPSSEQERKQKGELNKLKRETPEQRAERLRKQEEENTSIVQEVPQASARQGNRPGEQGAESHPDGYSASGPHEKLLLKWSASIERIAGMSMDTGMLVGMCEATVRDAIIEG